MCVYVHTYTYMYIHIYTYNYVHNEHKVCNLMLIMSPRCVDYYS